MAFDEGRISTEMTTKVYGEQVQRPKDDENPNPSELK